MDFHTKIATHSDTKNDKEYETIYYSHAEAPKDTSAQTQTDHNGISFDIILLHL